MIKRKLTPFFLIALAIFLIRCSGDESDLALELAELESIIEELEALELQEPEQELDRNGDGEPDFITVFENGKTFELADKNFDGRMDESWAYGDDGFIESGRVDANFDGILETVYQWDEYNIAKIFSDANGNGIADIYTHLVNGIEIFAERYYPAQGQEPARIGRIEFSFGYPDSDESYETTVDSELAFEQKRKEL